MRAVDQYVLRVLADRWAAPSRAPALLDLSRRGDGIAEELVRIGFRVTRIALADSSLETVGERLAGVHRHFDAVVCRDVLDRLEDWREVVGRAARRLHPGGVFVYGMSASRQARSGLVPRWLRAWLRPGIPAGEMRATLHRLGLPPREMIALDAETLSDGSTAYMGHSILRAESRERSGRLRWDFTGTGERWIAGLRG